MSSEAKNANKKPLREKVTMNPKNYFLSETYENYIVEYAGDIASSFNKIDYANILIEDKFFANVFVEPGKLNNLLENVKEIVNIEKNVPYNLSALETVNIFIAIKQL